MSATNQANSAGASPRLAGQGVNRRPVTSAAANDPWWPECSRCKRVLKMVVIAFPIEVNKKAVNKKRNMSKFPTSFPFS